jgi:16S rRNA (guanine(966)-N(2))-methyltransferase RsmD
MRIISGKHKGIRINAPKKLPVRPTTDMAKEALFNILNNNYYFDEVVALDLFSGIGSVSLELASRGVLEVTSVDKHRACSYFLQETANKLKLDLNVINSNVYRFLERNTKQYNIIFADPPYAFSQEQFEKIHQLIFDKNLLSANGMLIIEHSKQTNLSKMPNFIKERKYGGNCFSFFELISD